MQKNQKYYNETMKHLFEKIPADGVATHLEAQMPSKEAVDQIVHFDPQLVTRLAVQFYALAHAGEYYQMNSSFFSADQKKQCIATWDALPRARSLFEHVRERVKNPFESVEIGSGFFSGSTPICSVMLGSSSSLMELALVHKDKGLIQECLSKMDMAERSYEHLHKVDLCARVLQKMCLLWGSGENKDEAFCQWGWEQLKNKLQPSYAQMYWNDERMGDGLQSLRRTLAEAVETASKNHQWEHVQWWLEVNRHWSEALAVCKLDCKEQREKNGKIPGIDQIKVSGPERLKEIDPKNYLYKILSWSSILDRLSASCEQAWANVPTHWMNLAQSYCKSELAPHTKEEYLNAVSSSYGGIKVDDYTAVMQKLSDKYGSIDPVVLSEQRQKKQLGIYLLMDSFLPLSEHSDMEKLLRIHVQRQDHWVVDFALQKVQERFVQPDPKSTDHLFGYHKKIDASILLNPLDYTVRGGLNPKQLMLLEQYFPDFDFTHSLMHVLEEAWDRRSSPERLAPVVKLLHDELDYLRKKDSPKQREKIEQRIDIVGSGGMNSHLNKQGIRRFTLCGLAVNVGLWDCAEKLMDMGSDWRFAKKQVRDQVGFHKRADALAFYEGYEIKQTLKKVQEKKDKKRSNSTTVQVVEPTTQTPKAPLRL